MREVEFNVGDYVFLKVSPMHSVTRFGIKGQLALRYIEPYKIIKKIGDMAYHLNLSQQLSHVHDVFHVSMLKKYTPDPSHILPYMEIPLQSDVTHEEQPVEILAREVRMFHNKKTPMVKVLWERHSEKEVTWELESEIYEKYPHLF